MLDYQKLYLKKIEGYRLVQWFCLFLKNDGVLQAQKSDNLSKRFFSRPDQTVQYSWLKAVEDLSGSGGHLMFDLKGSLLTDKEGLPCLLYEVSLASFPAGSSLSKATAVLLFEQESSKIEDGRLANGWRSRAVPTVLSGIG